MTDLDKKLDLLITEVKSAREQIGTIEVTLVGGMQDSGREVGLLERVRKIENWIAKREWFEKLIIAAVVGNLIGLIFVIVQIVLTKP
jgi:hypothetical protein